MLLQRLASLLGLAPDQVAARLRLDAGMGDKALAQELLRQVEEARRLQLHPPAVSADVANSLGVRPDADLAAVLDRIGRLRCGVGGLAVRTVLGMAPDAPDQAVVDTISALRAAHSARQTRHLQLDAEALVDQAVKDGKVPPAHREFYLRQAMGDAATVREVINSLPTIQAGGMGGRHD